MTDRTIATHRGIALPQRPSLDERVVAFIRAWAKRRHQRRAIDQLSDHMLADMGLARGIESYEVRRHWQG